jgi:hypothetical protein
MRAARAMFTTAGRLGILGVCVAATTLSLGCDNTKRTTKTTEKRTQDTPEGKTTTTETHEKTVDVDKK